MASQSAVPATTEIAAQMMIVLTVMEITAFDVMR
jgi:hypothetical protein